MSASKLAGRSLLWALQGYLAAPYAINTTDDSRADGDLSKLREQLVVGHEEYRRVTYRDLHFQASVRRSIPAAIVAVFGLRDTRNVSSGIIRGGVRLRGWFRL